MPVFTYKSSLYVSFLLMAVPACVSADMVINEIMYDPQGNDQSGEWVEVYNSSSQVVTIRTGGSNDSWKFSDNSQHSLALTKGSATIAPGGYAVIVDNTLKFLRDWPNFSGTIFDSSLSLNNLVGELALLSSKNGEVVDRTSYYSSLGANGDGNSLQRQTDRRWLSSLPTPGAENSSVSMFRVSSENDNSSIPSAHYGSAPISPEAPQIVIGLGAGRQRIGSVGSPLEFKAEAGAGNKKKRKGYHWNMGDGHEKGGSIITHTYMYPGDYVVVLRGAFKEGEAVTRINVRIVDPSLSITHASTERTDIRNSSPIEVSLYGRALVYKESFFVFPKDTIIKSGETLSFGSVATGLFPQSSSEIFIAVLGDSEHPQWRSTIEEQRLKQISKIREQIGAIQNQMNQMFGQSKNLW